jgi:TraM recognition site of TraD and TraG
LQENTQRLYSGLCEWAEVESLSPKGQGLSVEKSLLNNAIVYIKGSLDDKVIREAMRILIMEIIQEARRLYGQRKQHVTLFIDELRFLTSNAVIDASATCAGFAMNMVLAYQGKKDIRNLEDVTINALAAETSIDTNCQLKFVYGTQDPDTCEWAARLSGERQKWVTKQETAEVGHAGEERWEAHRVIGRLEEAYITANTLLSLRERVGVLFQPRELPQIVFTCFVRSECKNRFDKQHFLKSSVKNEETVLVDIQQESNENTTQEQIQETKIKNRQGVSIEELG